MFFHSDKQTNKFYNEKSRFYRSHQQLKPSVRIAKMWSAAIKIFNTL